MTALHEKTLNEYITKHKEKNNGEEPTKEQISFFISLLIANGTIVKDTDAFIKELFNEFIKEYRSFSVKNILFSDTTLMLLVFGLSLNNILFFLSRTLQIESLKEEYFSHPSILIPTIILLFLSIYHFFSVLSDRKK